jgi:bifunctional oligoribonuclease and PAP phosphatase NrnA
MSTLKKEQINELKIIIENNNKFLLVNHIRMDPDAFWSLGGFYQLLKKLGKEVKATNDESMPENFSFLTKEDIIIPKIDIQLFNPEVIISFDTASLEQLWETYSKNKDLFEKIPFIVIDHHITNPWFWKLNLIDTTSSSSCELVYDIITDIWYSAHIDKDIATLLLAWIHTDTNSFYNKNTTSHTLEVAWKLIDLKAENKEIVFQFFRKKSLEKVHLWGNIMQKVQQKNGITWVSVTKEIYENTKEKDQWFKWFINEFLANIEGTIVALFLYEQNDGSIKASLRSNKDTLDVAQICSEFWWGWHKLAAGFTSSEKIENLENILLQKINTKL